jgi:PAS domain S-box-containing protein
MEPGEHAAPSGQEFDLLLCQIAEARMRLARLHESPRGKESTSFRDLHSVLDELSRALEKLHASEEEMRAQHNLLADSQAELEAQRERYYALFDLAPDAYMVTDELGVVREVNRAAEELFGFEAGEWRGKSLISCVEVEDRPTFMARLQALRRGDAMVAYDLHLMPRGGAKFQVSASVSRWSQGLLWLLRDVTERIRAEERERHLLQERAARQQAEAAEARLTTILESISDGFIALDEHGRVSYVNRRAEELLQRQRASMIGESVWRCFPELIGSRLEQHYRWAMENLAPVSLEDYYEPMDAWVEVHGFPSSDGASIFFRDITRRKRAEDAQRFLARVSDVLSRSIDHESTLHNIADLVPTELADGCVVYTIEPDGSVRRAATTLSGGTRAERWSPSGHDPAAREPDQPVPGRSHPGSVEVVLDTEAGHPSAGRAEALQYLRELGFQSMVVAPLVSRERTLGAIGLGRVDPRPYAPDQITLIEDFASRAALAADNAWLYRRSLELARAREEVLHVVSHDLRNSLNAMLLHTELLLDTLPSTDSPRGRPQVEAIRGSADHMHRLVQDLLDVESIEAGRLAIHPARCSTCVLLNDLVQLFRPAAEDLGVTLETALDSDTPAVLADRGRIVQVLSNLVGNALKFTPPGGTIRISGSAVSDAGTRGSVRFEVRDTGPGVPRTDQPFVFDRYWRGRSSPRGTTGSTGLGLTIARGIVEAHGGSIRLMSEAGAGACFEFTLPAAEELPSQPAQLPHPG